MGFTDSLQALQNNTARDIDLSGAPLNDENTTALTKAIANNTSMQTLRLSRIQLSKHGHKELAKAIFRHPSLKKLDFSNNSFTSSLIYGEFLNECFPDCMITSLNLSGNSLGHVSLILTRFAEKCPHALQTLDLSENKLETDHIKELIKCLESKRNLLVLNLAKNKIDSKAAEIIAGYLRTNSTLASFNLANNRIGNTGGKALANALKENRTLHFFNLSENRLEDESAIMFAEMLQINVGLRFLNLDADAPRYQHTPEKFSEKGTLALANALQTNVTLIAFSINFHKLNPQAIKILVELQKKPRFISLHVRSYHDNPEDTMVLNELIEKNLGIIREFLENPTRRQDEKNLLHWIEKGINPLITNDNNGRIDGRHEMNTVLHLATRSGWEQGVELLLGVIKSQKLDPNVRNLHGQTALDIAREMAERTSQKIYQTIIKLLEGVQFGNASIITPLPTLPSPYQPNTTPGEPLPVLNNKAQPKKVKKPLKSHKDDSDKSSEDITPTQPLTQRITLLEKRVSELENNLKKETTEKKQLEEQVATMQIQLNKLQVVMQNFVDDKSHHPSSHSASSTPSLLYSNSGSHAGLSIFGQQSISTSTETSPLLPLINTPVAKPAGKH